MRLSGAERERDGRRERPETGEEGRGWALDGLEVQAQKNMNEDLLGHKRQPFTPWPLRKGNQWLQEPGTRRRAERGRRIRRFDAACQIHQAPCKPGIHCHLLILWANLSSGGYDAHFTDAKKLRLREGLV